MEFPDNPKPSEDEMVNSYVKTLAQVLGSEEEAFVKEEKPQTSKRAENAPPRKRKPSERNIEEDLFLGMGF
ncbi:hypothetical protein RF400_02250, partial [Acinetobacter baumannii]|nr:hypothetical protein [Acinetobacter baumannii]